MPVATLLNDGKTIAVAVEVQVGSGTAGQLDNGIVFSHDNWAKPLGLYDVGPDDYVKELITASSAPYIRQFPSGETVLLGKFQLRLGDSTAHNFQTVKYEPLSRDGYGYSLELLSPHTMLMVGNTTTYDTIDVNGGNTIDLIKLYLNHSITAGKMISKLDGANTDWKDNTDALFVGSDSQAQETMRFAYDNDNIYMLAERLDRTLTDDDTTDIYFTSDTNDLNGAYRIKVGKEGFISAEQYSYGSFSPVTIAGIETAVFVSSSGNADEKGYNIEIKIPKASVGITGNVIKTAFFLNNRDEGAEIITDKLYDAKTSNCDRWIEVQLTIDN
jgi:hypothetical protein